MNCMNCKSVVDVGMEICPNCGFNLRVQRKCFSLSNMYYNLGLDKAEIREIIDHHRIANVETLAPVYFRNQPVGCTSTIIYQMYREQNIIPDKKIVD